MVRQAYAYGLLQDGQLWINMLEQRNLIAHPYDVTRAQQALCLIRVTWTPATDPPCESFPIGQTWPGEATLNANATPLSRA